MEYLSNRCKSLETLDIFATDHIDGAGLRLIANGCPELRSIHLGYNKLITDDDIAELAPHCPKLKEVTIDWCENVHQRGVETLPKNGCLRSLSLYPHQDRWEETNENALITDAVLDSLAQANPYLEDIKLTHVWPAVTHAGLQSLTVFCPHLKKVTLWDMENFSAEGIESLSHCRELEFLTLNGLRPIHRDAISSFAQCIALKTLCLRREANVEPIEENALLNLIRGCTKLTAIDIDDGITSRTLLTAIVNDLPELKELNLNRYIQNYQDDLYVDLSPLKKLKFLTLNNKESQINDQQLGRLLQGCSDLAGLDLSGLGNITAQGIAAVAKCCPNLDFINLSQCTGLNDEAIRALAASCPKLRYVYLDGVPVTVEGLAALARGCPELETLSLVGTQIGLDPLRGIAGQMPLLKTLGIKEGEDVDL